MPYDVTLVQFNGTSGGLSTFTLTGFPVSTPFNYLLRSMWVCAPTDGFSASQIAGASLFSFIEGQSNLVVVELKSNGTPFYNATFSGPVAGQRYNLLVSADCVRQIVQVRINDAPGVLVSGGWTGAGPLLQSSGLYLVDLGSVGGFPAVADLWEYSPLTFVNLDDVSNRRKFINADLTPVDLGPTGANPFGTVPPVFLTVPSGGVPNDFATNFGSGGSLTIDSGVTLTFQTPGTCTLPPVPVPGIPIPACGDTHTTTSFTASWTPESPDTATSYTVDWRKVGDISFTEVTGITDTSLLITGLTIATEYEFKVKAVGDGGESAFSSLVQCSTLAIVAFNMDNVIVQSLTTESPCTASQFTPPPDVTPSWGLRWSDTRGATFGNAVPQEFTADPLGQPQWNRTGMARDRVFELFWSAAYKTALNGAFVEVSPLKS